MVKNLLCFLPGAFFFFSSYGTIVPDTVFINKGVFITVSGSTFPTCAFNKSPFYDPRNAVLLLSTGDTLLLTVINNDSILHGFEVQNIPGTSATILPGDSITKNIIAVDGVWIYFDPLNYPNNRYMGLAGMITVSNSTHRKYFWNLKDHQTEFNDSISGGGTVSWNSYYPDYFTVNGKSYPDLQFDTTAVVDAMVGDTVLIFVANTGQSSHSIHFHGFHTTAVFASQAQKTGWDKDTWRTLPMECYVFQMVADKPGEYSVHDHNLVAVSGGGLHPNGMFLIMKVQ